MIFFILTTIVVQLVKFNLATLPFIQAYRRIKFKTITSDDQVVRDKNRNVFLIDSFTGKFFSYWAALISRKIRNKTFKATLYIFGRVPLSFIVHFYLVKMKVPDSIGLLVEIISNWLHVFIFLSSKSATGVDLETHFPRTDLPVHVLGGLSESSKGYPRSAWEY